MIFKVNTLNINTEVITSKLLELKSHWKLKSSDFPFYTLGKSAYLEGRIPEYKDQKDKFNKLLLDNFSDLYDIILTYLSKELNEPVTLTEDLAYPGFHIFESDPRFKGVAGNWHIDIPQKTLELTGTNNSTVTVVIKLPTLGGGIDWLDSKTNVHYLEYKEKQIVWHDGLSIHRIAGLKEIIKGEYRITLQGHLIKRNNKMELYW
jgi:hypothetical protein